MPSPWPCAVQTRRHAICLGREVQRRVAFGGRLFGRWRSRQGEVVKEVDVVHSVDAAEGGVVKGTYPAFGPVSGCDDGGEEGEGHVTIIALSGCRRLTFLSTIARVASSR